MKNIPLIFVLLLYSGGAIFIGYSIDGSSLVSRSMWSLIYLIVALLVYKRSEDVSPVIYRYPGLLILVTIPILSVTWSIAPATTFAHSFALLGTTFLGYFIVATLDPRTFVKILVWTLCLIGGVNVILALVESAGSLHTLDRFKGTFVHPNSLGKASGLLLLISLFCGGIQGIGIGLRVGGAAIGLLLLILCNSVSSIFSVSIAALVYLSRSRIRGQLSFGSLAVIFWLCTCVGGFLLLFGSNIVDAMLGLFVRDMTFTGRVDLWAKVWEIIMREPLLGYGYSAFWEAGGEALLHTYAHIGWQASNAHNGFLEIALGVGLLGLVVFILTLIPILPKVFCLDPARNGLTKMWIVLAVYLLVLGLTESTFMGRNSLQWLLLVVVSLWIKQANMDRSGYASETK